jgi:D-alanyl-lipoteichoic acid acyltransferase DltB (MBOAT superfamily)
MEFLPIYVLILVVTIVIDYFAGIWISNAQGRRRQLFLILSLIANIGFLCFFKYYDFFIININDAFSVHFPKMNELWLSGGIVKANNQVNGFLNGVLNTNLSYLETIILPIGLSFHTFQAMSYTIEVYRGNQKPERHFGIYSLYVMFYPQLVAGPIERPQNVLHQFHERKTFSWENLVVGLRLMAWGLFKKVVIADRLAIYVNLVYEHPTEYHWFNLVIATIFFAIQIYCDFSGYSDIAIGAARTMGYDLMINFRRPYFATNIKEFWDRWHISLSTWFRDYLYIPLGGSRKGYARQLINVSIVFLISGFWHGANWTFIVWGILHAAFNIIYMLWHRFMKQKGIKTTSVLWNAGGWLLTMIVVCFAWIFFRASSLDHAKEIINQIVSADATHAFRFVLLNADLKGGFGVTSMLIIAVSMLFMIIVEYRNGPLLIEYNNKPMQDISFLVAVTSWIVLTGIFVTESFIYFQF